MTPTYDLIVTHVLEKTLSDFDILSLSVVDTAHTWKYTSSCTVLNRDWGAHISNFLAIGNRENGKPPGDETVPGADPSTLPSNKKLWLSRSQTLRGNSSPYCRPLNQISIEVSAWSLKHPSIIMENRLTPSATSRKIFCLKTTPRAWLSCSHWVISYCLRGPGATGTSRQSQQIWYRNYWNPELVVEAGEFRAPINWGGFEHWGLVQSVRVRVMGHSCTCKPRGSQKHPCLWRFEQLLNFMGILSFILLQGLMRCSSANPQGSRSWESPVPDFGRRKCQAGDPIKKNWIHKSHSSLQRPDLVHHWFGGPLMAKERGKESCKRFFILVFCLWRES